MLQTSKSIFAKSTVFTALSLLVSVAFSAPVLASTEQICDQAAQFAASKTDVPLALLRTITRAETGRQKGIGFVPWPWTVNMEGTGKWFESEDSARAYVFRHFKQGARSFDVGCFQINYKWHGDAFASIEEMFDPDKNALYAAQFLESLRAELGSWSAAVGAYHSRTPKYANLYKARYEKILAGLSNEIPDLPIETATGLNDYPLLSKQNHAAILGSLVPLKPASINVDSTSLISGG